MNQAWPATGKIILGTIFACATFLPAQTSVAAPETSSERTPARLLPEADLRYADYADLVLNASVVAVVQIVKAQRLKGELAPGLAPDKARFLVEANVQSLFKGAGGLPGTISYIADVPLDPKSKAPNLKKQRAILLAEKVPGRPLELRLSSPYSQLNWTQVAESRVRAILQDVNAASIPPRVTGVGNAFYVPGAIPGESEAQIFLTTADNRPISLSILRRPGEQPQWAVALGEMVDDSAKMPQRDTLLWYRLACFLPSTLPDKSVAALAPGDSQAVRRDYRFVMEQLGACERVIKRP